MTTADLVRQNEALRIENDKMRQLLQSAAALAEDVVGLRHTLRDIADIATGLLAAISVLGGLQWERTLDAHRLEGGDGDE